MAILSNGHTQNCQPQNWLLVDNPEVGNPEGSRTNRVWNFWQDTRLVGVIIMKTNQLRPKNFTISLLSILLWKISSLNQKGNFCLEKITRVLFNIFWPTIFNKMLPRHFIKTFNTDTQDKIFISIILENIIIFQTYFCDYSWGLIIEKSQKSQNDNHSIALHCI